MALRKTHIEKLSAAVAAFLAVGKKIAISEDAVKSKIAALLTANMEAERALEDDAHGLLQKNRRAIGADIDEQRALVMIKKQLAKQRGFVL